MTEQRQGEIRDRAVLMARRLEHAGQSTQPERDAATLVLKSEGLDEDEVALFWSHYFSEAHEVRLALDTNDDGWRIIGENIVRWLLGEGGGLTVLDSRRPSPETAGKIRAALESNDLWKRLPGRRRTEADALAVDEGIAWLRRRAERTPLWKDLGLVIREGEDRGESSRNSLVDAVIAAGAVIIELLGPNNTTGTSALNQIKAKGPLFGYRYTLQYKQPLRRGTPERMAAELAADAICHAVRAGDGGDLAVHVPAAWEKAHKALAAAYDGFALSERRARLQTNVLRALPRHYRDALGISEEMEKGLAEAGAAA